MNHSCHFGHFMAFMDGGAFRDLRAYTPLSGCVVCHSRLLSKLSLPLRKEEESKRKKHRIYGTSFLPCLGIWTVFSDNSCFDIHGFVLVPVPESSWLQNTFPLSNMILNSKLKSLKRLVSVLSDFGPSRTIRGKGEFIKLVFIQRHAYVHAFVEFLDFNVAIAMINNRVLRMAWHFTLRVWAMAVIATKGQR